MGGVRVIPPSLPLVGGLFSPLSALSSDPFEVCRGAGDGPTLGRLGLGLMDSSLLARASGESPLGSSVSEKRARVWRTRRSSSFVPALS